MIYGFCSILYSVERGAVVEIPSLAGTWPSDIYRWAWHLLLHHHHFFMSSPSILRRIVKRFSLFVSIWVRRLVKSYKTPTKYLWSYLTTNSTPEPSKITPEEVYYRLPITTTTTHHFLKRTSFYHGQNPARGNYRSWRLRATMRRHPRPERRSSNDFWG